jgi:hypothetical protein
VDASALIFFAVAVAWAVYLVPMALKHHDEVARSRSVDRFSRSMRVLARREPVNRRNARLVVTPGSPTLQATVAPKPAPQPEATPAQLRAGRAAASRATKRRRNVLALVLLANVAVAAVAAFALIAWWYVAIPAGLLVAWLVACRIMVRGERRAQRPAAWMPMEMPSTDDPIEAPEDAVASVETDEVDPMADTSAGIAPVDPALWDPVPVTLPTYVNKPAATRRTVRTIDLDDTGVWTSGRTDADAQIAREADAADKAARKARRDGDEHRALGS